MIGMRSFELRRSLLLWVGLALVAMLNGCSEKRPEKKVYRVGVLAGLSFVADITDGFKAGMTELGYIEGQDIHYRVQQTDFDITAYKRILKEFVADKVDLIVVFPTEASMEAKAATEANGIPVVFTFALIEGMGLVESVRHPGGNITGVRYPGPDVVLKRFEITRELAPQARRILVCYQRDYPIVAPQLESLRTAATSAGVTLIEIPATNAAELEAELKKRSTSPESIPDAILIMVEPLAVTPEAFTALGRFAAEHNVPMGGALMSLGGYRSIFGVNVDNVKVGKQAAPLADQIFKGTPAGAIPVVSAESFFNIDYKAAQALGLKVPEGLLSRADEIIR